MHDRRSAYIFNGNPAAKFIFRHDACRLYSPAHREGRIEMMKRSVVSAVFAAAAVSATVVSANAAERWPKEIIDSAKAHCTAMVVHDSPNPAAIKQQADDYCTCLIDGFQGVVSIGDFQQSVSLPPDQFEQLPASRAMHQIVDRCSK
jgi:hypothetical protein